MPDCSTQRDNTYDVAVENRHVFPCLQYVVKDVVRSTANVDSSTLR